MMIRVTPTHLMNQLITVISGGLSYDSYGTETYSTQVVASGRGRLEIEEVRLIEDGQVVIGNAIRAFVEPTVSGHAGHLAEIDGTKYRINGVVPLVDGRGAIRLQIFRLAEVSE